LWQTVFTRAGVALHVRWAWGAAGDWAAADNPRVHFARTAALYKLYILCPFVREGEDPGEDAGARFARDLLPELDKALFSSENTN
jgi:hypothetical protein